MARLEGGPVVVEVANLLPEGWLHDVTLAAGLSLPEILTGESSTSREGARVNLPMRLTRGGVLQWALPWLHRLYLNELRATVAEAAGCEVFTANDPEIAMNLNVLEGDGRRYERHVDSNPYTAILFAISSGSGGDLAVMHEGARTLIPPLPGTLAIIRGDRMEHWVTPLEGQGFRVSLPLAYYADADNATSRADTDYLSRT